MENEEKFCEYCGNKVHKEAVMCPKCGRQIERLKSENENQTPQIVINNTNSMQGQMGGARKECDKWISLLLCLFLGFFGGHKFYEGKTGLGIIYIFTGGLFFIGVIVDLIVILCRPNPYYV